MNPHTGELTVPIHDEEYILRYDWDALAAIEAAHGETPDLFNPDAVASIAAIGFRKHHPELTAARIKALSPPLIPFAQAVQRAIQWAYYGLDEVPDEPPAKKKTTKKGNRLKRLLKWLFRTGSTPNNSGD